MSPPKSDTFSVVSVGKAFFVFPVLLKGTIVCVVWPASVIMPSPQGAVSPPKSGTFFIVSMGEAFFVYLVLLHAVAAAAFATWQE